MNKAKMSESTHSAKFARRIAKCLILTGFILLLFCGVAYLYLERQRNMETVPVVADVGALHWAPKAGPLAVKVLADTRSAMNNARLQKSFELENSFKTAARRLDELVSTDIELFKQDWTAEKRNENAIRVCQFNILAHGLSDFGSGGFATQYKDEAPLHVLNILEEYKNAHPNATKEDMKAQWKKFSQMRDDGRDLECWSIDEKAWLHRPEYLEVLFSRTWGQKPYPIPERIKRVASVILKQLPDVICLQELDHFAYFTKLFEPLGYKGEINYKCMMDTRRGNGTYGNDGVAVFWNTQRLEKVESKHIKLWRSATGPNKEFCNQRLVLVTLRNKDTGKQFAVMAGHFRSGTQPKDLPMKKYHLEEAVKVMQSVKDMPLIFTCDFNNSVNTEVFKLFQTMQKGKLDLESAYDLNDTERLSSVKIRKGGDQPEKTGKAKNHTIDYIFHSKHWKTAGTLQIPLKDHVLKATNGLGLPCWKFPSDHFMLAADLELL